jgi:hypothetical protein
MKVVRSVQDKEETLKARDYEQKRLGQIIDRMVMNGKDAREGEDMGCGGSGVCPSMARAVGRFMGLSKRSSEVVPTKDIESVGAQPRAPSSLRGGEISRAVLGLAPSKKKTPAVKLEAAAMAMKQRFDVIESRACEARQAAQASMQAGNKANAMRELKKSKALQKQAISLQAVMDAVDAQSAMLEQTALQKQVAAALGETAKTLKKEKGLLSKAEDAVESASEMRDLHEDLTQVMAGLGDSTVADFDDDELASELAEMMIEPVISPDTIRLGEYHNNDQIEEIQSKFDSLEAVRQMPAAPKKAVKIEKQSLLSQ